MGICTGASTNWQSEAVNPPVRSSSLVSSSTIGNEDLYQFPGLLSTITQIYTVTVSGNCYLSGPGNRQFDLRALSGGTDGGGSHTGQIAIVTPAWYDSNFDVDPNTSIPWTAGAVMSGFFGMKLTA
jgi:hypothetical protein